MALAKQQTNIEPRKRDTDVSLPEKVRPPLISTILLVLTTIGMMSSIGLIFLYVPTDAIEGIPQRIFYFHVPIAWIGMLAFGIMAIAGVAYLWKKDERWDWLARASAEI